MLNLVFFISLLGRGHFSPRKVSLPPFPSGLIRWQPTPNSILQQAFSVSPPPKTIRDEEVVTTVHPKKTYPYVYSEYYMKIEHTVRNTSYCSWINMNESRGDDISSFGKYGQT